jgi:hypothetical protein
MPSVGRRIAKPAGFGGRRPHAATALPRPGAAPTGCSTGGSRHGRGAISQTTQACSRRAAGWPVQCPAWSGGGGWSWSAVTGCSKMGATPVGRLQSTMALRCRRCRSAVPRDGTWCHRRGAEVDSLMVTFEALGGSVEVGEGVVAGVKVAWAFEPMTQSGDLAGDGGHVHRLGVAAVGGPLVSGVADDTDAGGQSLDRAGSNLRQDPADSRTGGRLAPV